VRTHPPTLITLVRGTLRRECGVAPGDRVLVAVSGGVDSTALLHVLARLRTPLCFSLTAYGVDHGLRPEARKELQAAAKLAASLDVTWDETRVALAPGGNLQARARALRWEALEKARVATKAQFVATAHHADDRAETLMMRLLRGTGPDGLAVLGPREGTRIRPMIRATRTDVDAHVARHRLVVAHDPSNRDPRFLRTRVRAELMPLLLELNPGAVRHLCAVADAMSGGASAAKSSHKTLPYTTLRESSEVSNGPAPRRGRAR